MSRSVSRRDFLRLAALTATGTALAACAAPTAAPTAPIAPTAPAATEPAAQVAATPTTAAAAQVIPTQAPPAAEKVTLQLWSINNVAFVQTNEALAKKFMEANPNVEVIYQNFPYADFITKIQTSMAAKNEADVLEMFGSWVQSYAKGNTLAQLPEGMMTLAKAKETYYAAPLDGYTFEGKLYGLPNEFNIENGGVLINKRMFKDAGVTDPPVWGTWDELVSDAKKLTKMSGQNMTVAGFDYVTGDGLGFLYWQGVLERGADYFAADKVHLDFLTPEAEATVQWLTDMALKDKVVDAKTFNGNSNWVGDAFWQGLVAIGFIGPWIVPPSRITYADFADPWAYVSTPHYGEKMSFAADSGFGKCASPNSKNIQNAWDLVLFFTADKTNARAWNVGTGMIPAMKAVAQDPTLLNDMNWIEPSLKILDYGRYVGNLQDRDFIWYNVIQTRVTECLQGLRSVKETMAMMNEEANKLIDSKLKS